MARFISLISNKNNLSRNFMKTRYINIKKSLKGPKSYEENTTLLKYVKMIEKVIKITTFTIKPKQTAITYTDYCNLPKFVIEYKIP